jgi:hypothetical protein
MTNESIIQIAGLIIGGLGTIVLGLLTWGIKELIGTILSTKFELAIIKEQLKSLIEDNKSLPKMKEDLNALHSKVRSKDQN